MHLTSHERLMRIFRNQEIDRPALKLWGAKLNTGRLLHPSYKPVTELAVETTDLVESFWFPMDVYAGQNINKYTERYTTETGSPDWVCSHTIFHTPKGDLHQVEQIPTNGEPGYTVEHAIKEPEDIDKMLSMEYTPFPLDKKNYEDMVARLGDRGVVMLDMPHAAHFVQRLMGSETLAYFSIDERENLHRLIQVYADRLLDHTKAVLDLGIQEPVFGWCGPELFLPPLMGVQEFEEFVHDMDKPIGDAIHNAGGHLWVHSHGKVADFIDSFIDMGVDVLNPLEPPKNGDIEMNEIIARYGNRIGWEGNIEIQEILLSSKERLRNLIDECVEAGNKSGRFILCPSSGYMECAFPSENSIDNLMFYLQYGLEAVERCR